MSKPVWPDNQTKLCLSLSAKPGNFGTRFHNYLFRELGLNMLYLSREIHDFKRAVVGLKEFAVRGCAVSMPFKVEAMEFMDSLDSSAREVGALNTILNNDGKLVGYNTDTLAVAGMIQERKLQREDPILVLGAGGMARAVLSAFKSLGFSNLEVMARSEEKLQGLNAAFAFEPLTWSSKVETKRVIVNATSLGFKGATETLPEELRFTLRSTQEVWDMVADPVETALVREAREAGLPVVPGSAIAKLQAVHQFRLYTRENPTDRQIQNAFEFAVGAPK